MIRISLNEAGLQALIDAEVPNWDTLTAKNRWSKLKPLFIDVQHYKCAYCEAEFGGRVDPGGERDTQTQDVEHFRPKGKVEDWTAPDGWNMPFSVETGPSTGYTWLGHEPLNYVASCIPCNRTNKKMLFPILSALGDYSTKPSIDDLGSEKPYLVFPAATVADTDPEKLIAFLGPTPRPHPDLDPASFDYWRAMVTIKVLNLERPDLDVPRKELVVRMAKEFVTASHFLNLDESEVLDHYCEPEKTFSACAKCYRHLCMTKPAVAKVLAVDLAEELGEPEWVRLMLEGWVV